MKGAELLAKVLIAYDVRFVFGVPGDTNVALYGALHAHANEITHIMARDERSAGYMADAYARASNRPGVVEVPSGAGPLYAIAAIAEAHLSSVPVIIITNENSLMVEGRGFIAELDSKRVFEPVTKASILVKSVLKIPETIRRAFRLATSGRPGAVHIAIPENLYHEEINPALVSLHAEEACKTFPAYPARSSHSDLTRLQRLIADARRPLVVAGGGVNRSNAREALTAFAERYRLPVVTTITGQQAIADRHELSIGVVGDNGFHPHASRAMEEADLLLYVGCKNGSVVSIGWTFPAPRKDRRIVQVDIDPEVVGNNTENALSIVADARLFLDDMNALPATTPVAIDPHWIPTLNQWRQTFWEHTAAERRDDPTDPLRAQRVIEALNRRLKGAHLLFSDPGTPTPYLCRHLRLDDPRSRVIMQRAYGGLGYAIPAVIGGWYARPNARPIGLFGDGSLGMSVGDLETIARLRIPAILMNFNNAAFGWIKALQQVNGHPRGMSVDFSQQDCAALARAFGLRAVRVEAAGELENALDEAFAHNGPIFLDLVVRSVADELPPVYNWLRKRGIDPLLVDGKRLTLNADDSAKLAS